jgi:hypothetical protein
MNIEVEIYSLVLHRLAESDHGWGKPYDFHEFYALDYPVPGVETEAELSQPADGRLFNDALKSDLQAKSADLPPLSFVHNIHDVYDASRQGPVQVCNGGAFIALGPVQTDTDGQTAKVGVMFYAGHRWARWMRYHLERFSGEWRIARAELLAVS